MNSLISETNKIYDNCCQISIAYHLVEQNRFKEFCFDLKKFQSLLSEEDEYWQDFLSPLKRYRFQLCVAPLPFNAPFLVSQEDLQGIEYKIVRCKKLYPDLFPLADHIWKCFNELTSLSTNPLYEAFKNIHINLPRAKVALLIRESHLVPYLESLFKNCQVSLITPPQVRTSLLNQSNNYKNIVIFGSPYWFPEYIFTAPRTSTFEVVNYHWVNKQWKAKQIFIGSEKFFQTPISTLTTSVECKKSNEFLEPEEIYLPTISWNEVNHTVKKYYANSNQEEVINSKLFILEGKVIEGKKLAVFLDVDTKIFVIDLQQQENLRLKKIVVSEIEIDMFLLLRTSGGGDYVFTLANQFLGEDSKRIRDLQKDWKNRLNLSVKKNGLQFVSQSLVAKGSKLAKNTINIRNWISEDNIKPKDFDIILDFLSLENRKTDFLESATLLRKAHQKAGHHIRKLLLNKIRHFDLSRLEQLGVMEFELEEADGGSITAYRVIDISPDVHPVPFSKVNQIFQI